MTNVILYSPTEASHADATTLVTFDNSIDENQPTVNLHDDVDPYSDGSGNDAGLRVGHSGTGSNYYRFVVRVELPSNPSVSAGRAALTDKNLKIKKII